MARSYPGSRQPPNFQAAFICANPRFSFLIFDGGLTAICGVNPLGETNFAVTSTAKLESRLRFSHSPVWRRPVRRRARGSLKN